MSHAKLSLQWSVKHYQVTFEGHSGRGSEMYVLNQLPIAKASSEGSEKLGHLVP